MFKYVSCPHYLSEIIVYTSLAAILGFREHLPWLCLTGYVCSTQLYLAHSTHAWYKKEFANYPKERRSILPFIF